MPSKVTAGLSSGGPIDAGPNVYQTDLQANARHLAEGTGGFAMDNSNDLRGPLQRVMEDVRSHYEVTYAPVSENYDGHFRKLEVRLAIPGLKVQSRAGYYAAAAGERRDHRTIRTGCSERHEHGPGPARISLYRRPRSDSAKIPPVWIAASSSPFPAVRCIYDDRGQPDLPKSTCRCWAW